jgi:hypothetical protein
MSAYVRQMRLAQRTHVGLPVPVRQGGSSSNSDRTIGNSSLFRSLSSTARQHSPPPPPPHIRKNDDHQNPRQFFSSSSLIGSSSSSTSVPYRQLIVGIPKETAFLEKRVAATPESVQRLVGKDNDGFIVHIQDNAGAAAYFDNASYEQAGAVIVPNVWETSDIVLKVSTCIYNIYIYMYILHICTQRATRTKSAK